MPEPVRPAELPAAIPTVIGHRGAAGHAPENTLAGLRVASRLGARWVEVDVRLSEDGRAVLMHDDTLDRTTDGTGIVAEVTYASMRLLDAGSWFGEAFRGERVPELRDVVSLLFELNLGMNFEIKGGPEEFDDGVEAAATAHVLAQELDECWPRHRSPPLMSSLSVEALAVLHEVAPHLPRALLVEHLDGDWEHQLRRLACSALHVDAELLDQGVVSGLRRSLPHTRLAAFTVNCPTRAAELLEWGVELFFTDYPDRLSEFLALGDPRRSA